MSFMKRTIVVTGATGGLGAVLCADMASRGANLALVSSSAEKLHALADRLALPAERCFLAPANLLDRADAQRAADGVEAHFGRVDALLHTVGGWVGGSTLVETPPADLEQMLAQHVWSSFLAMQAFAPAMVRNGWGRVVMIGSPSASRPTVRGAVYAAAKAGQEALVRAIAAEMQGTGVTANMLLVRMIDMQREKIARPSPENAGWSTPEEISAAVAYLLSDEAGTVNGASIPLFGRAP